MQKYSKPRRMILLTLRSHLTSGDLSKALNSLPSGSEIIGTHYNSTKAQCGLIISNWVFDPVRHGSLLPEYQITVDTAKGVYVERHDEESDRFITPGWSIQDSRSWLRKLFDFFFD